MTIRKPVADKPPYVVPSMAEVAAVPWNGYTVASTFSGCGGSCLGYRMAGFRVVWANEFVEEARASYVPNHPDTLLDPRDIRKVKPIEILRAAGLRQGELDLFDGSPPCQSFSTAGKRERGWGLVADHADGSRQVSDDLFFEYARLLRGLRPKTFVAENVSGLVKGTAKGYFKLILAELKACGYVVEARVLDAQWLGVPQCRQRVIFVGVRDDLGLGPVFPSPLPYRYSVLDACPWIGRCVVGNDAFEPKFGPATTPTPTLMASGPGGSSGYAEEDAELVVRSGRSKGRRFSLREPSPAVTVDSVGGMGGSISLEEPKQQPELVTVAGFGKGRRKSQGLPSPSIMASGLDGSGPHQVLVEGGGRRPGDDVMIEQTGGFGKGSRRSASLPCPTPSPSGMGGTQSPGAVFLDGPSPQPGENTSLPPSFVKHLDSGRKNGQFYGRKVDVGEPSPTVLVSCPGGGLVLDEPAPARSPEDISGTAIAVEADKLGPGGQSKRYFQLVRADENRPTPSITASGGQRGLAGVIHPRERRKFTIAEVRRLCAFPDDFVLVGSFAQQWARLGNSVPPLMMRAVATAIREGVLDKIPKTKKPRPKRRA